MGDYTHVIPALIHRAGQAGNASESRTLRVWGHAAVTRDFMYAPEAARAILHSLDSATLQSEFINIASGSEISMGHVASVISRNFGLLGVEWKSEKPIGVPKRSVGISKLRLAGFEPDNNFESQIGETIDWYRQNLEKLR